MLAQRFFEQPCPHIAADSCAKMVFNRNNNGALPFSSKKSVLLAYTLGRSRTARVKIILVKRQGGNLARKESTRCRNRAGRPERVPPNRKRLTDFEARRPTLTR